MRWRASLVVEWVKIQAFRGPVLKLKMQKKRALFKLGLSTSPASPRVLEILQEEVCMCITRLPCFVAVSCCLCYHLLKCY